MCVRFRKTLVLFAISWKVLIISTIQDFLSPAECKTFVKFIDDLPLELTPPKRRGEADRLNRKADPFFYHQLMTLHCRSLFCDIFEFCSEVAHRPCSSSAFISPPSVHETR